MDDINGFVNREEQAKTLKNYLPKQTENFDFHIKGIVTTGEKPTETLNSNATVGGMGYNWILQTDVMMVNTPPILIDTKQKGKFTTSTVWFDKPIVTKENLNDFRDHKHLPRKG